MSTKLLQYVAECFQGKLEGMHCLGAVSGGDAASPTGAGNRGGVMSVVRALGVLVCEGRIQGPPRGYKEGPHCAAPLQASPDDHVCDEDNYLCGRYLVLVREIAERITIGSSLSVEVLMCSDCPCGLARSTCKAPVSIISSTAISQWQHPSDILLEYWSIGVVPSKSPEMMNSQGLYQAVRSRLHFSQVAAWWSRSNGTRPSYVTTRIVSHSEDNLRKFRESPIEHTFPLAGIGDGNSIKVTVWALPRMEEVPTLNCPVHPIKENDEECVARALTPTKNGPLPSSASHPAENLVLPVLVDDRLQTSCDKPGKHHCHCEDEDGCPPSPSIRPNGERKRRRSLPCGPPEIPSTSSFSAVPLPSVRETIANSPRENSTSPNYARYTESQHYARNYRPEMEKTQIVESCFENHTYLSTGSLERSFRKQVSLEDNEDGNDEKRYKTSHEHKSTNEETDFTNIENSAGSSTNEWRDITDNCPEGFQQEIGENTITPHEVKITKNVGKSREMNVVVNLLAYRDSTPGTSSRHERDISLRRDSPPCTVHNYSRAASTITGSEKATTEDNARNSFAGKELSGLMSKLSFPKEKTRQKDEGGILEWFSKVPGRVMAVPGIANDEKMNSSVKDEETRKNELRYKNCNLELSQREFNEVLAVLRARTPSGRRRTPVRTLRRREKERTMEDSEKNISRNSSMETNGWRNSTCDKNDVINSSTNFDDCVCPIHRNLRRDSSGDNSVCEICEKTSNTNNDFGNNVQSQTAVRRDGKFSESRNVHEDPRIGRNAVVKSQECVQNVANKADVLLGAILRTNRERKGLVDISNGTKRRNAERTEKIDEATKNVGQSTFEPKVVPFEDEKSLPSVLNKRLHRFKQLFKKEWEKREITNSETSTKDEASNLSQDYGNVTSVIPKSRVKRKIDFANFSTDVERNDKNPYENLTNDSISGTHQNLRHNNRYIGEKALANGECAFSKMIVDRTMSSVNNSLAKSNATPIAWQNGCTTRTRKQNEIVGTESDDDETVERGVPSAIEQEQFRRSLENAASMVFHSRTGLPLTSSPAPLRRGSCCFDYDSTLNSVSSKRSALFELNTPPSPGAVSLEETDREIETSGEGEETPKRTSQSRIRPQSHALLGSFEESALNGRLEPVSTVHGFTAELGASGSFCPKHRKLPVTVFFYTLGDNDKVSTPYLAHINLGKKGYQVPRSGTIQVTLLNPLGTVVKMFVVLYDLSDMPPRSHTFLRQRTLRDKTLRYLVHLRFMSGKSGRIYLHTDIRMIICRKSDVDTASDFGSEPPKELRSYIHGPTNPKFSPRC